MKRILKVFAFIALPTLLFAAAFDFTFYQKDSGGVLRSVTVSPTGNSVLTFNATKVVGTTAMAGTGGNVVRDVGNIIIGGTIHGNDSIIGIGNGTSNVTLVTPGNITLASANANATWSTNSTTKTLIIDVEATGGGGSGNVTQASNASAANHVFVSGGADKTRIETPVIIDPATGDVTGLGNFTAVGGNFTGAVHFENATISGFPVELAIACSDLTTTLTTGTGKAYIRAPRAFTVTEVRASVLTAQTGGSLLTVNIKESGTTILSTLLTFDNNEKTTTTAATPAVISDTSIADDAEITVDITQVGTGTPVGLIVTLLGYR